MLRKSRTPDEIEECTSGNADDDLAWPEEAGNGAPCLVLTYRRWTFSFMNRILRKGSQQRRSGAKLTQDDLYRIPTTMESEYLTAKFHSIYEEEQGNLVKTLFRMAAPTFVPAGFCQLITVLCQVAIPLFVRQLLIVLEENPSQKVIREGVPLAVLIFFVSALNALGTHRHRHLATKSGVVLRATMVSVVFGRALNMTPAGREGLTSGEVTNLVAVDTQKLFEVTQEGHLVWSCPLSMILVTVCLLVIMGWTTIVGMVVLFLFVPIVEKIATRMLNIRHERVKVSDERVETISSMLQGMKVTKLNNYESRYQQRIEDTRNRELKLLRKELAVWAVSLVVTVLSPGLAAAATFATFVLVSEDNILTVAESFSVLLLFSALRFPINYAGRLIGRAAQALEACRRLSLFLSREQRETSKNYYSPESDPTSSSTSEINPADILSVKNGVFQVGAKTVNESNSSHASVELESIKQIGFSLSGINLSLGPGQILAVVGPVGAGKSTLINGIIGEVPSSSTTCISKDGRVAYASQIPFILNSTLKENILFGLPFDKDRYEQVLDACCLRPDIAQLGEAGDNTQIGERGVTLSGGQKQRVSLARAAYSKADIVLCDDILSALDANTSRAIFDRLFKSSGNNLLSSSAVVLVTHASNILNRVDKIMVIVDGRERFLGTWDELVCFQCDDESTTGTIRAIQTSVQESKGGESLDEEARSHRKTEEDAVAGDTDFSEKNGVASGKLMTVETREHGISSLKTWLLWFQYAGGIPFILVQVLLLAVDRFAYVATEWWLARWTQGAYEPIEAFGVEFDAQIEGRSAQYDYLKVYATIILVSCIFTFLRSEWAVTGGARCSRRLFSLALSRVLFAPMSYFETTPLGRILNRFTFDIEVLDLTLTESMTVLIIASGWFITSIVVMVSILPWIGLAIVPITLLYVLLMLHYRQSGTDLQRLDAVSRSPIQAMLAEGLDGASIIRVFQQEESFIQKFDRATDINSSSLLNFITAQRWVGLRIEMLGSIIVLVSCVLVVCLNDILKLDPGLVALLIIWSSNFTITLGFLIDNISESEAAITSIERVCAMSDLPQENPMTTASEYRVSSSWPERGFVKFDNVCLRYRKGLPLALDGLSFEVSAGRRCAVVGRTGAGKSTLTAALFRIVELESGQITVDGVDLSALGLSDVRGRMAIIPQDPVLFPGTLRECLDPFGSSTDEEILEALVAVRLSGDGRGLKLDDIVEEGGVNYSVGERQLLCLARALLNKPRVLVLDEATASVDGETDAFIQRMLRTRFEDTTIICIAHRLHTIMDYDLVLVMDEGKAVEFSSPQNLLEKDDSVFSELVNATGVESALALREMTTSPG